MKGASWLAAGPLTVEELFDYPESMIADLQGGLGGPERFQRLQANIAKGVKVTEDYAGMSCPAHALAALEPELQPWSQSCTPMFKPALLMATTSSGPAAVAVAVGQ